MDIMIRNARLRGKLELVDLSVTGGRIESIASGLKEKAALEIDAGAGLVTESYCNPHLHLCKVYTLEMMDELALKDYHASGMGKAMTAIELASRVKENYDQSWIIENVRRALDLAVIHGNLHIRAFADVDSKARLEGVKALIQAREEYNDLLDLQVVAFPQDGVVREPGAEELIREALNLGVDLVGGIPWIEYTEADELAHIRKMFALAIEYDRGISMLVDDAGDPTLKTLEMMAVETVKNNWQGRVLAHHARAMELYPKPYFQKLAALLKKAQIGVVSDPHTGPLHARVKELLEEGVLVCLGQDDISDAYYPYGRNNMLEVAFLASHLLWMTGAGEMETIYDMITCSAGQAMGLKDHTLREGAPANLVILEEENVLEALRCQEPPAYVIYKGRLVADNKRSSNIYR